MTTLPSNLARVGEDLARATLRDAHRSVKRRRLVACAIALALLALTASAGIATGWLSEKTPTSSAVPSLSRDTPGVEHTLLTNLGAQVRVLKSSTNASGAVCLSVTGVDPQCVPTFLVKQQISWFERSLDDGTTLVFGLARDDVTSLEAISPTGDTIEATLANGAFYLESLAGAPTRLLVHLNDGSTVEQAISPCPSTTPDCVS